MPGFNGTGPQGAGPMTGRARGNCTSPTGYNPGVAGEFRGPDYGAGLFFWNQSNRFFITR